MPEALYALLAAVTVGTAASVVYRRLPKSLHPLLPREHDFRKRRDTLRAALELLEARGATTLIETGTARGGLAGARRDGASTVVFAAWAKAHGARLHSVDIDPVAVESARRAVAGMDVEEPVRFHVGDSVRFLADFGDPVDFLYLDSYDYHRKDPDARRASQEHHLREFQTIEARLHEGSVVLIDDCRLPGGGKGRLVIRHMLQRGWKAQLSRYQVLLVRS